MACYHPIRAYKEGARVTLWPPLNTENLALPCGNCIGCKSARATEWARRCAHEAKNSPHNIFLTLTYEDDRLPENGHLRAYDLTNFIKRLRKRISDNRSPAILRDPRIPTRYFACGEYGDITQRPHYHAIVFNAGFNDGRAVGNKQFISETLSRIWGKGRATFGDMTPAAANYVAQYSLKKQAQHLRKEWRRAWACDIHTQEHFTRDGEILTPPPFLRMSLKPAIGTEWLRKFRTDLTMGYLIADGKKIPIPRRYMEKLKEIDPTLAEEIQGRQAKHRLNNPTDANEPERLRDAEIIHKRLKQLTERRKL